MRAKITKDFVFWTITGTNRTIDLLRRFEDNPQAKIDGLFIIDYSRTWRRFNLKLYGTLPAMKSFLVLLKVQGINTL